MIWIGILLGIYLLLCLLVFTVQDRVVFPAAGGFAGPLQVPDSVRVVWLTRPGGERFRLAESTPASTPVGVMVFFPGNGEDLRSGTVWAQDLAAYGLCAVVVEYPGYGASEGSPSVGSFFEAAETAADHGETLARELSVPLMLGGSSLGTFCAVHLAALGRGERLLLKSPPTSALAAARASFWWLPVTWLLRHRFDSLGIAPRVRCPTLIVHGDSDRIVPASMGQELRDALSGPARLILVPGHGHNDPSISPGSPVEADVRAFLRER